MFIKYLIEAVPLSFLFYTSVRCKYLGRSWSAMFMEVCYLPFVRNCEGSQVFEMNFVSWQASLLQLHGYPLMTCSIRSGLGLSINTVMAVATGTAFSGDGFPTPGPIRCHHEDEMMHSYTVAAKKQTSSHRQELHCIVMCMSSALEGGTSSATHGCSSCR